LNVCRHWQTRCPEKRGSDVEVQHECIRRDAAFDEPGIAHEQRNTQRLLIRAVFATQTVLAPEIAVVAGEDDEGVVELLRRFEGIENARHTLVYGH
jgi:hypothetical protein